eukprot:365192-Chlamydomonas_euryale.AAC.15
MENMARRPFLISFTFSSAKVSGSSARPRGSKYSPPGYSLSRSSPKPPGVTKPAARKASAWPIRMTWIARVAMMDCACTRFGLPSPALPAWPSGHGSPRWCGSGRRSPGRRTDPRSPARRHVRRAGSTAAGVAATHRHNSYCSYRARSAGNGRRSRLPFETRTDTSAARFGWLAPSNPNSPARWPHGCQLPALTQP